MDTEQWVAAILGALVLAGLLAFLIVGGDGE